MFKKGTSKDQFLEFREKRDKVLGLPRLFYPSIQFNLQAGKPIIEKDQFFFKILTNYNSHKF